MSAGVDKIQTHIDTATEIASKSATETTCNADTYALASIANSLVAIALMMKEDHDKKDTQETGDPKIGFVS